MSPARSGTLLPPTLVLHGAVDRYVPVTNAAALAEAIPDARLRVLDDAGHLIFIERFADVNREVVIVLKPGRPRRRRPREPQAQRKLKELLRRVEGIKEKISSFLKPRPTLLKAQGFRQGCKPTNQPERRGH